VTDGQGRPERVFLQEALFGPEVSFPKTQTCYNVCRFLFACVSPSHAVVVPQWA
jgi:hypothetical protein